MKAFDSSVSPAVTMWDVCTFHCPVEGCARALSTQKLLEAHLAEHKAGRIEGFRYTRHPCSGCGREFKTHRGMVNHRNRGRGCGS